MFDEFSPQDVNNYLMLKVSFTPSFFRNMKPKIVTLISIFLALNPTWQRTDLRGRKKEKGGRKEQRRRRGGEIKLDAEATEEGTQGKEKKFHTVCLLFFTLREKPHDSQ